MNFEEFAADLATPSTVHFNSAEESEEAVRALGVSDYELRQLGRGSCRVDMALTQTSEGFLSSRRYERSLYSPLRAPKELVFLIIPRTVGGDIMASGEIVPQGGIIVQTPDTQVDFITSDLTAADTLGLPASRFFAMLEAVCPGASSIRPGQVETVAGDTLRLKRLRQALVDLVNHPESDPRHERHANLIAEVIAWMGDYDSQWQPQGFSLCATRTRVARQARDYLEDHYQHPVRLADLCGELDVSLRTMQRAFVDYYQVPPYDYLKKLRLNRAQRELLAGEADAVSVTEVALKHGYSHLSRFARDYREIFGELPSDTLAR